MSTIPSPLLGVGLSLPPDPVSLTLLWPLFDRIDYCEVAPETLWRRGADARYTGNSYRARFLRLRDEHQLPFVAHGVGLSMAHPEPERRQVWLRQLRQDQADFDFQWYTDHLGWTHAMGQNFALPLPAPDTVETRARMVQTLRDIQSFAPAAGVENTASYFLPYPPLREPVMLAELLDAADAWLLLDLHNLWMMATNFNFDPSDWLARAPLDRVIEIHVAGGKLSAPGWLPDGRTMRLDSHDAAVPEAVWSLLAAVRARCPNLRGVTLEYIEGSFTALDLPRLQGELDRIRACL